MPTYLSKTDPSVRERFRDHDFLSALLSLNSMPLFFRVTVVPSCKTKDYLFRKIMAFSKSENNLDSKMAFFINNLL